MQKLNDHCKSRYYFEHSVLRNWFYGDDTGEELIRGLLKEGGSFPWDAMSRPGTADGIRDTKEQYRVSTCKHGDGYSIIRIDMPKPQRELLCFQVYLAFSSDFRQKEYFTVERGVSPETRFLCSWEPGEAGGHCNYGQCSADASETEKRIAEIFANREVKPFWKRRKIWWCASAAVFIGMGAALCAGRKGRRERN